MMCNYMSVYVCCLMTVYPPTLAPQQNVKSKIVRIIFNSPTDVKFLV